MSAMKDWRVVTWKLKGLPGFVRRGRGGGFSASYWMSDGRVEEKGDDDFDTFTEAADYVKNLARKEGEYR